jgi:uncharacterized protein YukE
MIYDFLQGVSTAHACTLQPGGQAPREHSKQVAGQQPTARGALAAHIPTLPPAVKPWLLLLLYNRCRESARRMRAKRSQEVKHLETTVNKLQDKNQRLEEQNREYAKSLQQLQDEMRSLRTQLQGNMGTLSQQQQQQSSSEVHQVCCTR